MNQKGLVPVLIVILIALAIGGYLIYQQQSKSTPPPSSTTQPSPSPTASPAPTGVDETTNWKTYTGLKFTFKYPQKYHIIKSDNQVISFSWSPDDIEPFFVIYLSKPSDWSKNRLCSDSIKTNCLKKEINKVALDGKTVKEVYYTYAAGPTAHIIQVDNPSLELIFTLLNNQSDDEFKQILSTFKFTQ